MKQLTGETNNIVTNLHNGNRQHPTNENVAAAVNQKHSMQFNTSNSRNCADTGSDTITTTTTPNTAIVKSGLHLSFVANVNESSGTASCRQCQIVTVE
ncbi:hypothetical protein DOY81_005540 [Sarcophaga bullata]|nr:hypothetical protein DOY81_005540 [Sarcophaga bullata]